MIAFLYVSSSVDSDLYSKCSVRPNVGGVVGLADLYVDPALGFSMGWSAWYNWSITLRTYYRLFFSWDRIPSMVVLSYGDHGSDRCIELLAGTIKTTVSPLWNRALVSAEPVWPASQ